MDDAARARADAPDLTSTLASLAAATLALHSGTRSLHAATAALLGRVSTALDDGSAVSQLLITGLYTLQARYEESRLEYERVSTELAGAAGSLHFHRQAVAAGIAIGEARQAVRRPGPRHAAQAAPARNRRGLRALAVAVIAATAGTGTLIRHALGAHRLHIAAAAMTTAALTSAVTVTMVTVPYATAPQRQSAVTPAAAVPATAPAALATIAPLAHHRRRRHPRPRLVSPHPVTVSPSGTPPRSPSPSPSPSSQQPGEVTAPPVMLADGTGDLTLTASGGPADWSVSCSPGVTVSQQSGHLGAGLSVTVTVTSADPLLGGTCWLQPGDIAVQVRAP